MGIAGRTWKNGKEEIHCLGAEVCPLMRVPESKRKGVGPDSAPACARQSSASGTVSERVEVAWVKLV